MSYFVIEDFRLGLDRRKHILTLPPGALYELKNANITRGGEIETAKAFAQKYSLPAGQTFGMAAAGGELYTFGSVAAPAVPSGVLYQRLQHPSGATMTELVWTTVVKGKVWAIAAFTGGLFGIFYDGAVIADWYSGAVGGVMASNADIASHFATIITTDPDFSATSLGSVVTITGEPGVSFSISTNAVNGGAVNDQYATPSLIQAAVAGTPETLAKGSLTISGSSPGHQISSVTVNGVQILGATITNPGSDAGYASAIAAQINAYSSTPEYTANVTGGNVVEIVAAPGTGAGPNGLPVARTLVSGGGGTVVAANMAGGVAAVGGVPQISTVTIGGTFEDGDVFSITLDGKTFGGTAGAAGVPATAAMPHRGKTYAIAGPNLLGSAIDDATEWNGGTGSFVTDMSSENAGSERLTGLGIFENRLAVYSRTVIQIWIVDSDPANNEQVQVLENIGTLAPKSVQSFGDADQFFLSDTGVRSLRVRINTDNASLSDIGSPIDPLIIEAIAAAGGNATKAAGVIDPIDGRYLLQIGTTTYAFSFFPNAKVSAWSTWETGLEITHFAVVGQRLYARAGDKIYLLGGDDNDQWAAQAPVVKLPFLSQRQIATLKHFTSFDVTHDGEWDVYVGTDPNQPDVDEAAAKLTQSTIGIGIVPMNAEAEAISIRFVGKAGQYGRIANVVVHYEAVDAA